MNNQRLRSRVSNMLRRDEGDDAVLDLILGELVFEPQHQVIINSFSERHSLPRVTATSHGRSFLTEAIADGGGSNEEEFELLMSLHEELEDETRWMLTAEEHKRFVAMTVRRERGARYPEAEYKTLASRFRSNGAASSGWGANAEDSGQIFILPSSMATLSQGVEIGANVPADLKERIKAAVLAVVNSA